MQGQRRLRRNQRIGEAIPEVLGGKSTLKHEAATTLAQDVLNVVVVVVVVVGEETASLRGQRTVLACASGFDI
jgi:hypothetical protein